jgi:hypothetical protein
LNTGECLSLFCFNGRCLERSYVPCYSNTECGSSIIYGSSCGKSNGTCSVGIQFSAQNYFKCTADTCTSNRTPAPNTICGCESQYIALVCSSNCLQRVDLRKMVDGYVYDCTALTRTLQPPNTCEIKATVINCPASSGSIQKLSLFVVMVILLFL